MGKQKATFKALGRIVDHLESIPLRQKMKEIEDSKFIGEDGKEYFRLPLPPRYARSK